MGAIIGACRVAHKACPRPVVRYHRG
jgi:hypothetical protein